MPSTVIPAPGKKLDKNFSGLTALPSDPASGDLLAVQRNGANYKVDISDVYNPVTFGFYIDSSGYLCQRISSDT